MGNKIIIILVTINIIAAIISKIYLILWVLEDSKIRVNKQFFVMVAIIFIILNSFLGIIFYIMIRQDDFINYENYFKAMMKYETYTNCLNQSINFNSIRKIQIKNLKYLKFGGIFFLLELSMTTLLTLRFTFLLYI